MLFHSPLAMTVLGLITLHCMNGFIAALIARRKGLEFSHWLVKGLIGGTISLVQAIKAPAEGGSKN